MGHSAGVAQATLASHLLMTTSNRPSTGTVTNETVQTGWVVQSCAKRNCFVRQGGNRPVNLVKKMMVEITELPPAIKSQFLLWNRESLIAVMGCDKEGDWYFQLLEKSDAKNRIYPLPRGAAVTFKVLSLPN